MAILGTKKFWRPTTGASTTQVENQILKNSGYINIQLYSVNYMSKGNFWQKHIGGTDNVVLTTGLRYQSTVESIDATSVQDMRQVKANRNYNFGIQRNIAVKIPATANAIALEVKMTVVKTDALQAKFEMLNQTDYQNALQLMPGVVGQVLTITSLVKKLFTDSGPNSRLEASFSGIISLTAEENPVSNGKLTKGMLIMISTDDGDAFENVDETKFDLRGDTLYYKNTQVENTYVVFNISFEALKGEDQDSAWFKKYNEALNNLDKIYSNRQKAADIYKESMDLWIQGNALLEADATYIQSERVKIKGVAFTAIEKKYNDIMLPPPGTGPSDPPTGPTPTGPPSGTPPGTSGLGAPGWSPATAAYPEMRFVSDVITGLTGSTNFNVLMEALPATGSFLKENKMTVSAKRPLSITGFNKFNKSGGIYHLLGNLEQDSQAYLEELRSSDMDFNLGNKPDSE